MTQEWFLPQHKNKPKLAFVNARIIDPESGFDDIGGIIVTDGIIQDFGSHVKADIIGDDFKIIDCKNHVLCPGLIDIQVHFREPGQTHKEDINSGSKSAVAGGITTVVCQPNTSPVIDNVEVIKYIRERARETSYLNLKIYPAISRMMKGVELSDMAKMAEYNEVVGFTDDGLPVMNAYLMMQAMKYAKDLGLPVVQHAEDLNVTNKGCINEGAVSYKLGVNGIPNVSESIIVARDLELLAHTGGHYHVLHVSTRESLELIRAAKKRGLHVTCEAAPHHFMLTDEAVLEFGSNAKMNPPLRSALDRAALIEGLKDGSIDAIATDHAPHDVASKLLPLAEASFGIVGVETMLPLSLELYHNKIMPLSSVIALMTNKPAKIIKSKSGIIAKGAHADLTLIDLDYQFVIDAEQFASKSKNTPFNGRKTRGKAVVTCVGGEIVYSNF
jgi:dihydroorotase